MALARLVDEVNKKFKEDLTSAIAHNENPRIISMLRNLVRLTNSDEDNKKMDEENETDVATPTKDQSELSDEEVLKAYRAGKFNSR